MAIPGRHRGRHLLDGCAEGLGRAAAALCSLRDGRPIVANSTAPVTSPVVLAAAAKSLGRAEAAADPGRAEAVHAEDPATFAEVAAAADAEVMEVDIPDSSWQPAGGEKDLPSCDRGLSPAALGQLRAQALSGAAAALSLTVDEEEEEEEGWFEKEFKREAEGRKHLRFEEEEDNSCLLSEASSVHEEAEGIPNILSQEQELARESATSEADGQTESGDDVSEDDAPAIKRSCPPMLEGSDDDIPDDHPGDAVLHLHPSTPAMISSRDGPVSPSGAQMLKRSATGLCLPSPRADRPKRADFSGKSPFWTPGIAPPPQFETIPETPTSTPAGCSLSGASCGEASRQMPSRGTDSESGDIPDRMSKLVASCIDHLLGALNVSSDTAPREEDLTTVILDTKEQRMQWREFMGEAVSNSFASSLYTSFDVEPEPPKYAKPPSSAPDNSESAGGSTGRWVRLAQMNVIAPRGAGWSSSPACPSSDLRDAKKPGRSDISTSSSSAARPASPERAVASERSRSAVAALTASPDHAAAACCNCKPQEDGQLVAALARPTSTNQPDLSSLEDESCGLDSKSLPSCPPPAG
mmetsp:Transcript_69336/g.111793  ORF Transcript_69336/g.111793 Transcript_69336/m.111793 type:complete len:581 (-) Transcript_69336:65-1807(-)